MNSSVHFNATPCIIANVTEKHMSEDDKMFTKWLALGSRRGNSPIDAMLFLEFEFTFKTDCLPYATFSMVSELQDVRQPT